MYNKAKYFYSGNETVKTEHFDIKELEKGFSVYEVVKITKGIPVFFEDHIERLHHSAKLKHKKILFDNSEITEKVCNLIEINKIKEGRLKFVVRFHASGNKLIIFFLNPITPSEDDYKNGVNIKLFEAERPNPNAKIINYNLRTTVNKVVKENNIFEVLFYNKEGFISECSKSNIFFIKNNIIYTSFSKDVLPGITRKYIYQICRNHSLKIEERKIKIDDLQNYNSAFITGTSLGVLPVKLIDKNIYNVNNKIIKKLSEIYNSTVKKYISEKIKIS